ncbi:serine/threonine-protein kinase Nek2 [Drosophila albomicans]|uniref:non-specific serine/threonine protein kinase n=1 Tax=Drosophila albomicans TaxID=7291 RepID=A0A6P8XWE5_DROAB|nr:serine/threonine-protein kinase Nek2 [Drosophila albomicans]
MSEDANATTTKTAMCSAEFAQKTLQDYEVLAVMGNGAFGTCYKVKDKTTGLLYAWKGMNYDELDEEKCDSLVSEISVLRQLQHPNIVQYYHHLINREAKSIYIVMECCDGGDLDQLIKRARSQHQRFEESYIWRVLFQLCRALQVCHNQIPSGTILHRDIKPANIFLDAAGNVKLGDFGLARVLRRDQCFAASFVGTPHYMSPELVKGRQYDRKSDVWAVGCLIYELCALHPPFRGRAFQQLSENIAQGQFNCIPRIYSEDLQSLIGFMLAVPHEERPSIEVISRHPLLVRNIQQLPAEFPRLLPAGDDFQLPNSGKLFPESPASSLDGDYGQRQLSALSGVFTPDLRSELFYSAKRRILGEQSRKQLQQSDPALYDSVRKEQSPRRLTEHIFDEALQQRLHAIRAREALLDQRDLELQAAEQRVQQMERELRQKLEQQQSKLEPKSEPCQCQQQQQLPPLPPRKTAASHRRRLDDSYCSIELNETTTMPVTVAKMNLAMLTAPKQLHNTLRKVTFQSPPPKTAAPPPPQAMPMQMSVSSNESQASGESQASSTRRKSILSLFGLSRHKATVAPPLPPEQQPAAVRRQPLAVKLPPQQQQQQQQQLAQQQQPLTNMWTKEQKRAAFDLLAAMNAAEKQEAAGGGGGGRRQQLRQSVRERNSSMQRNRMRRSLVLGQQQQQQPLQLQQKQMLI